MLKPPMAPCAALAVPGSPNAPVMPPATGATTA